MSDDGAIPSEYARFVEENSVNSNKTDNTNGRYALPKIPENSVTTLTAEAEGETTITKIVDGNSFSIRLKPGKEWTVSVSMKNAEGEVILSSVPATYDLSETAVTTHDFYLQPLSSGSGTISLGFSGGGTNGVFTDVCVISVNGELPDTTWSDAVQVTTSGISMIEGQTLLSGIYDVTIGFKKDGLLVYYTTQTINVFGNMETDTWVTSLM